MVFEFRRNYNHGLKVYGLEIEQLWLCVVGIVNHRTEYFAAILGFICADEMGKAAGWH